MLGEQKSGGYNDGAKFMQRKDSKPELIVAFEHHHDHIALADALGAQHVGGFVTVAFQVAVGENMLLPAGIAPNHRPAARLSFGDRVHHVVGKIEIFRILILVVDDIALFIAGFVHISLIHMQH